MLEVSRRGLITGLASFLAAPAIVRASSLMPVKARGPLPYTDEWMLQTMYRQEYVAAFEQNCHALKVGDLVLIGDRHHQVVEVISSPA